MYTAAAHSLGFVKGKQRDWFNENDPEINIQPEEAAIPTSHANAAVEDLADGKQLVG